MTILHTILNDESEHYLLEHSQYNNADIDYVFNSAYAFDEPHMQISKLQATAIQFFIATSNIRNIVEVGTFVGFSAFIMAKVLHDKKCKIVTIEKDKKFHSQAEVNQFEYVRSWSNDNKRVVNAIEQIEFINADAKDYFSELIPRSAEIDMIFLDGDKEHYSFYVDWACEYLRKDGYLLIDNALFKGGVVDNSGPYARSIREATQCLKQSNLFDYFFLPVGDCMIVARKK